MSLLQKIEEKRNRQTHRAYQKRERPVCDEGGGAI